MNKNINLKFNPMEVLNIDKVENLFSFENFDTKKILNRSTKSIDKITIEKIEKIGVTSEMIKDLKIPVFHYMTQITLHGLFDANISTYIGGYKNLICNKNLSLGVKYNAVDYDKKQRIYKHLQFHYDFGITKNSQSYDVFKQKRVTNIAEKNEAIAKYKPILDKIPTHLFYGGASIRAVPTIYGLYIQLSVNVGAIFESDINEFFIKTFGMTEKESLELIEAKDLKEKKERDAQRLIDNEKRNIVTGIKNEILENEINRLKLVYGDYKKHNLTPGINVLEVSVSENCEFFNSKLVYDGTYSIDYEVRVYDKEKSQKIYRSKSQSFKNESEIKILKMDWYGDKFNSLTSRTGFLINPEVVVVAPVVAKTIETTKPIETKKEVVKQGDLQLIDYSEKSFAVIGNTKPIKEKLKELGGSFNFRLSCGAGWIFPITKKQNVLNFIN